MVSFSPVTHVGATVLVKNVESGFEMMGQTALPLAVYSGLTLGAQRASRQQPKDWAYDGLVDFAVQVVVQPYNPIVSHCLGHVLGQTNEQHCVGHFRHRDAGLSIARPRRQDADAKRNGGVPKMYQRGMGVTWPVSTHPSFVSSQLRVPYKETDLFVCNEDTRSC